jgi:hypothetical protein
MDPLVNTTTGTQAHVLIDLTHALPSGGGGFIAQKYVRGELHVASDFSSYTGTAHYDLGWNQGAAWQICALQHNKIMPSDLLLMPVFCGNFSMPASVAYTYFTPYNFLIPPATAPTLRPYYDIYASDTLAIGALFTWEHEAALEVEARVGVSFLSEAKACAVSSSFSVRYLQPPPTIVANSFALRCRGNRHSTGQ